MAINSKIVILQNKIFHLTLIIITGLLAYSNTFAVPFHFDDLLNIVDNPRLRDLGNFWPPSGSRWFGEFTFALNYNLGGLDSFGYHVVNLAVHILNSLLVYWFVVLTLSTPFFASAKQSPEAKNTTKSTIALFSSLVFVSHPVQTQAVTYIVQRFTSLAAFFYLLSLVMYILSRFSQTGDDRKNFKTLRGITFYSISLFSAVLAMKTKEISFTLPVIIIIYEFSFFNRASAAAARLKRLLYLLPLLLTILIIPSGFVVAGKPIEDTIYGISETLKATNTITRADYFITQIRVIMTYIRLLFMPINQSLDYGYPLYQNLFTPSVLLSLLFHLLLFTLGCVLYCRPRSSSPGLRLIAFGIFWFFITLTVESSIIPLPDLIFEHRLYLPSAGFFISAVTTMFMVSDSISSKTVARIIMPIPALIIITLIALTYARNKIWQQEITLWEDVIAKNPANVRGYNMAGIIHKENGDLDKAESLFRASVKLEPGYAEAHVNLGAVYIEKGMIEEGFSEFMTASGLQTLDLIDSAALYLNIGNYYLRKGLPDKAIEYFNYAQNITPGNPAVFFYLGRAYYQKGLHDKASEFSLKAHNLNPDRY